MQEKNTNKMFEMYDKANSENREAIKACTDAINKLCDRLERLKE
jgi:polyhydroxyalkanoate synthesis regulator phasin